MTLEAVEALLSASIDEQRQWTMEKFPRFGEMAYTDDEWGDTCIGIFYPKSLTDLSEYEDCPEEKDTIWILRQRLNELSEFRENQNLDGSRLTEKEAHAIRQNEAEEDTEGWIGLHGWEAQVADGTIFVAALGYSEGQGGIRLGDAWILRTRNEAQIWLETHEIWDKL